MPRLDNEGVQSQHLLSLPNRSDPKTKSTPFDDMLGQVADDHDDRRRMSDLSEMDYLAQTALSNNLMTGAVKARIFPTVSAPSLENDEFAKSNITGPSEMLGLTKRTDNNQNLFHRMDDVESLAMTP